MKIPDTTAPLKATGAETIQPSSRRLIQALRAIGYSLEQAIADLIDNSINAEASTVLVRFISSGHRMQQVAIVDDGHGMDEAELSEAMRFGTESDFEPASLGKYGLGLKLASFSQARSLTVISRRDRQVAGRRWTVEGISEDWICDKLDPVEARTLLDAPWRPLDLKDSGTIVLWGDLDKIALAKSIDRMFRRLNRRLSLHVGLHLHRFLEDQRLRILVDHQVTGEEEHEISFEIEPLNPFAYSRSGREDYPQHFNAELGEGSELLLDGHIWPPNSTDVAYKLGGRAAAMQGLYFYRNERLIQAGGWNGLREHDSEPHTSLARVRIDLPPEMDSLFGLNVQKSKIIVPDNFAQACLRAKSDRGVSFQRYLGTANQLYRKKDAGAEKDFPLVPSQGISGWIRRLWKSKFTQGARRTRGVDFEWRPITTGGLFELDRENKKIYLNRDLRTAVLHGRRGSKNDAPLLKMLLLNTFGKDLDQRRVPTSRREEIEEFSDLLAQIVRREAE